MALKDKLIRYRLIDRHRELVRGSQLDMEVAQRILHFLNHGEIRLSLGDADWHTELELEHAGVQIRYSRNGYTSYARLRKSE